MSSHARVFNATTRRYVKPGQAQAWVADGVCEWVEQGLVIRSLTFAEMVAKRSALSRVYEPFPMAELPGIVTVGIADIHQERTVAWQGTRFAESCR
jgi:hypothetical protein